MTSTAARLVSCLRAVGGDDESTSQLPAEQSSPAGTHHILCPKPIEIDCTSEEWSQVLQRAAMEVVFVLAFLWVFRRIGAIKELGTLELLAIGALLHMPSLCSQNVSVSLSVALNIVLLLRVQEVHADVDAKVANARAAALQDVAAATGPLRGERRAASAFAAKNLPVADSSSPRRRNGSSSGRSGGPHSSGESAGAPAAASSSWIQVPHLTSDELTQLSGGELVLKQIGSNEGVAAQRIEAPVDLVWATLLDFAEWPRMVDDVVAANVYERNDADIKVEIVVGVGFLKLKTYIHHVLDQAAGTLTWTLDERKSSDLLSNTGYWMVRDGSSHGGGSVVYYSCAVQLRAWAPGWLDRYIAREGLPRALGWLKREVENRAAAADALPLHRRSFSSPNLAELSDRGLAVGVPRSQLPSPTSSQASPNQQQQRQQAKMAFRGLHSQPQHRRSGSVTIDRSSSKKLLSTNSWRE